MGEPVSTIALQDPCSFLSESCGKLLLLVVLLGGPSTEEEILLPLTSTGACWSWMQEIRTEKSDAGAVRIKNFIAKDKKNRSSAGWL